MPTTFNVFSLGTGPLIDQFEGGTNAGTAGDLVGLTFGGSGDPLYDNIQELSPGSTGFAGGIATGYDQDNDVASETFVLDGGAEQTFDALSVYSATLTYADGTTATINAIVFQDTVGNLYLAPQVSANGDQDAMEAKAIESMTLNALTQSSAGGLSGSREAGNYVTPDGAVDGTSGNDDIGLGFVDAQGDQVDGTDGDNDSINGGAGNDTIFGGNGNDTIDGGDGTADRVVFSGNHDNYTYDITGPNQITVTEIATGEVDTVSNFEEVQFADGLFDLVVGTDGSESITHDGESDGIAQDLVIGGDGADTINSGDGDDVLYGGAGNDSIMPGSGADTIYAGAGDDVVWLSGSDSVDGGDGIDTLDATYGAFGEDIAFTSATGGVVDNGTSFENVESFVSGDGADSYDASLAANDVSITTGADNDTVTGGSGADTIDAGSGADVVDGGGGDDRLVGGSGADTFTGGAGADVFVIDDEGDLITDFDPTAGIDGDVSSDNDFVDLSAYYNSTTLAAWNAANPGQTYSNPLGWLRADQANGTLDQIGGLQIQNSGSAVAANSLTAENTAVMCFAQGTLISTLRGPVPIERLARGDLVQTMDHGLQPLRWIGSTKLEAQDLAASENLRPIRIRKSALSFSSLVEDLIVSPQHRVLVVSSVAKRMTGQAEVLIAAKHLLGVEGIDAAKDLHEVRYYHILFDRHEIVFANGLPAESLYLGLQAQQSLSPEGLAEVRALFPKLMSPDFAPRACRRIMAGQKARQLCWRHCKNQRPLVDPRLQMPDLMARAQPMM